MDFDRIISFLSSSDNENIDDVAGSDEKADCDQEMEIEMQQFVFYVIELNDLGFQIKTVSFLLD